MTDHPQQSKPENGRPYGMDFFADPDDEAGIFFDDFIKAMAVWAWMRHTPPSVQETAEAFGVTVDVIRRAVDCHPWCFLSGPDDDPSKQLIEADGE